MKNFFPPPVAKRQSTRRGGFSLAETVIALTVITLVAIVAIVTIRIAIVTLGEDARRLEARTAAGNALEIFKYTRSVDEFDSMMRREDMEGTGGYYRHEEEAYRLTVVVRYDEIRQKAFFEAYCYAGNGKRLFAIEYEKSVADEQANDPAPPPAPEP
ncbi:MAG: hypothetical protein IKI50_01465 [Clostridia bacterium]|nr:hypothetical protein [Clostridia bacterium]